LRIAWSEEPDTLGSKFITGGGGNYMWIFNSYLTYFDFQGVPHPMMAKEIPAQDSGSWVINADGSMVTTYLLRDNISWHDGAPLTAEDFVFAFQVYTDPDVPVYKRIPENLISAVHAPDPQTVVVTWKGPYVYANVLGYQQLDPLPRHILAGKYETSKDQFALGAEWTTDYVGNGPFRVERWDPGSALVARAHGGWFLGAPKLETIEIRFINDPNTLLVNLMGGEVDMTTSPAVRGSEAAYAHDQWVARGEGYVKTWATRLRYLFFQFREVPNWQSAVTDVRVRRALLHALDRDALADTTTFSFGSRADAFFMPTDALFPEVERAISKYPYDPGRAGSLLDEAAWQLPAGASVRVGAAGQTLDVEVARNAGPRDQQEISVIADFWKTVGVNSSIRIIPAGQSRDGEVVSFFPGTMAIARTIAPENFVFTSKYLPTVGSRWRGSNRGSFVDPEVERLQDLVLTSMDPRDRREATIALHKRMSEVVGIGPLYYEVEVILAKNSVKGPVGNYGPQQGVSWNVFEWEILP
jgi:peptide/nickel transport system substrate-binding protein